MDLIKEWLITLSPLIFVFIVLKCFKFIQGLLKTFIVGCLILVTLVRLGILSI